MAALVALPLAACAQDPEGLPPSTQNGSGDSWSSSAPTSAVDPELEVVKERAKNYQNTQVSIATHPKQSIDDISLVARGDASGFAKRAMQQLRAEGNTASGSFKYRDVTAKKLKPGVRPRAQVKMCIDASGYTVKDAKGKARERELTTSLAAHTLEQWGDTWYVTKLESQRAEC